MDVRLVTPHRLLFALTALLPLAVFALGLRRLGATRRALGMERPPLRSRLPLVLALAAAPALLGVAAAQPVVETTKTVRQRTDVRRSSSSTSHARCSRRVGRESRRGSTARRISP